MSHRENLFVGRNKILPFTVVAICGLLLLFAVQPAGAGGQVEEDEDIVLTWHGWDPIGKYQPVIDAYEERNPHVTIEYESFPEYDTRMMTAAVAGELPDIMSIGTGSVLDFAEAGLLMDVTDELQGAEDYDMDDFWDSALPFVEYDGRMYGAPNDGGTYALVYNRIAFDEAGIDYPDETWDWDDFQAAADALTIRDGGSVERYGSMIFIDWGWPTVMPYIWQNGGRFLTEDLSQSALDEPEAYEAIQWVNDLDKEHGVVAPIENLGIPNVVASFINEGEIAMGRVGLWETHVLEDSDTLEWAAAPMPQGAAGHAELLYINGLGVSTQSDQPEEALEFLKFATSAEGQEILLQHTAEPQIAVRESLRDVAVERFEEKRNAGVYVDAMEYSRYFDLVEELSELIEVANREIDSVWFDNEPADQVLPRMAEEKNQILGR